MDLKIVSEHGERKSVSNAESSYHSLCCQGFTEYLSVDIERQKKGAGGGEAKVMQLS